jgi:hypothetical protein
MDECSMYLPQLNNKQIIHQLILRHGLEGLFILIPFAPHCFHQPRDFRLFDLHESSAAGVREGRVALEFSINTVRHRHPSPFALLYRLNASRLNNNVMYTYALAAVVGPRCYGTNLQQRYYPPLYNRYYSNKHTHYPKGINNLFRLSLLKQRVNGKYRQSRLPAALLGDLRSLCAACLSQRL